MTDNTWTREDSQTASVAGWDLFTIWDDLKSRFEYEIQGFGEARNDALIKAHVKQGADDGDKLCQKAVRLAFLSKMSTGSPNSTKSSKAKASR